MEQSVLDMMGRGVSGGNALEQGDQYYPSGTQGVLEQYLQTFLRSNFQPKYLKILKLLQTDNKLVGLVKMFVNISQ